MFFLNGFALEAPPPHPHPPLSHSSKILKFPKKNFPQREKKGGFEWSEIGLAGNFLYNLGSEGQSGTNKKKSFCASHVHPPSREQEVDENLSAGLFF